ncbi:MAG: glycosyltransferase family 39 protein [Candidatus Pacebacteria bacterium]|nr:glycosyltransferase family 39 protein [Candidatus Paceibacterota bacterium]
MKKVIPILPFIILAAFVGMASVLMIGASRSDSAVMDELAHIPAGYGYVKYNDYRLNPEHPPLVKILSATPLAFQNLNFPTDKASWTTDVNGQWSAGAQFLYESGNDADKILFWSRIGPILLTLLLILGVYGGARELMGRWWALLPALFIALSPNFLAHGHYVTTDVAAAFGIFFSIMLFLKFLSQPSKKLLFAAGIAFGVAQLAKFSAVLLIPYFLLIISTFYLVSVLRNWKQTDSQARLKRFGIRFIRYFKALFIIFIIGYILVYIIYALTTFNYPASKQLSDSQFILQSFSPHILAEIDFWMIQHSITKPFAEYFLGVLMVLQRSAGGNTAYFMGEVSGGGWWYYFPLVFAMKESLAILIVIALAFLLSMRNMLRNIFGGFSKILSKTKEYLTIHFTEFSMLMFVIIYWAYSMKSPLNIGFRHLIPTLPFIYILAAGAIKKWTSSISQHSFIQTLKYPFIFIILAWLIANAFISYPYYLSRFNELAGGTYGGYKYVTDSNFDWGQDLKRLQKFVDNNKINKIAIDYFGGGSPKYYLGDKAVIWNSSLGNPNEDGVEWVAISANSLQSAIAKTAPGFNRNPQDEYLWLKNPYQPTAKAGTSIFIYKLSE